MPKCDPPFFTCARSRRSRRRRLAGYRSCVRPSVRCTARALPCASRTRASARPQRRSRPNSAAAERSRCNALSPGQTRTPCGRSSSVARASSERSTFSSTTRARLRRTASTCAVLAAGSSTLRRVRHIVEKRASPTTVRVKPRSRISQSRSRADARRAASSPSASCPASSKPPCPRRRSNATAPPSEPISAFLASGEADYAAGTTIDVNGASYVRQLLSRSSAEGSPRSPWAAFGGARPPLRRRAPGRLRPASKP